MLEMKTRDYTMSLEHTGLPMAAHSQLARCVEMCIGDKPNVKYKMVEYNEALDQLPDQDTGVAEPRDSDQTSEVQAEHVATTGQDSGEEHTPEAGLEPDTTDDLVGGDVPSADTETQPIQFIEVEYT